MSGERAGSAAVRLDPLAVALTERNHDVSRLLDLLCDLWEACSYEIGCAGLDTRVLAEIGPNEGGRAPIELPHSPVLGVPPTRTERDADAVRLQVPRRSPVAASWWRERPTTDRRDR